jgi:hypothetical protein
MEATKYRKKPVVIEAMQMTEDQDANQKIAEWIVGSEFDEETADQDEFPAFGSNYIEIETLEGTMTARPGDYIIRGVQGEFYPCKPDIFEQTYERVSEPTPSAEEE